VTHIKDFNKRFGITLDTNDAQNKFIRRIDAMNDSIEGNFRSLRFLDWLTIEYGQRFDIAFTDVWTDGRRSIKRGYSIASIHQGNFLDCLKILEFIFKYSKKHLEPNVSKAINENIIGALDRSEVDLGIRWHEGRFFPSGVKVLDEKLVEDVLDWLNDYPDEKKDFDKILKALVKKEYNEVVSNSYKCIESLARNILGNNKTLENNKLPLLSKLKLSKEWNAILNNYLSYANEYGKHGSGKRHDIDPNEAEAFLYLTGLIIRLCMTASTKAKAI
jgi:hypothetical protein